MGSDPYFENNASRYAAEAIRLDSRHSYGSAIESYEKAVEELVKFILLYPTCKLNKVYMERAGAYRNRIKALRKARRQKHAIICITSVACITCRQDTSLQPILDIIM